MAGHTFVAESEYVVDGITGSRLAVDASEKQLVDVGISLRDDENISQTSHASSAAKPDHDAATIKSLCDHLMATPTITSFFARRHGQFLDVGSRPMVIKASAGSGKTFLTIQAIRTATRPKQKACEVAPSLLLIPLRIPAQALVTMPELAPNLTSQTTTDSRQQLDLIEQYISYHFRQRDRRCCFLLDAYHSDRLVLVLDGLDEAPELIPTIAQLIESTILLRRHRFLATSRPEALEAGGAQGAVHPTSLNRGLEFENPLFDYADYRNL